MGAERQRCLWLTKGLGRGGVERLLVDMYPLIDHDRFDVDVAYILPWKDSHRPDLENLGAEVHCLGENGHGNTQWPRALRSLLRRTSYDVIHTHAPVVGGVTRLLEGGRQNPAIVHTEHNLWGRYRLPTRWLNALTYHRNDAAIAVSDSVAQSIKPVFGHRAPSVHTIHHGIVPDSVRSFTDRERAERRRRLGLEPDDLVVAKVANFTPKKDHANLLRAFAGEGPVAEAKLVLVGLGPTEEATKALATELGIQERVLFLGSRTDVFELLPLFDVFCLSSQFEGFPISLVEAMASGLGCVATSVGGIPEILNDGANGLLVAPGDHRVLRSALERLLTDHDLRLVLAKQAREDAQGLDLRAAVQAMEGLYRSVVGAHI